MADTPASLFSGNASFDPFNQTFTLLYPDGHTPIVVDLSDVSLLQYTAVNQGISQGMQAGAAVMLLLVLLLTTRAEKRRSCVFIVNASALLLVILRATLTMVALNGPFFDVYRFATMYYIDVQGAKNISSTGEVCSSLLFVAIEISLAVQVHIVCCNLETFRQLAINTFNGVVAFVACALRFALMVLNINWNIQHVESITYAQFGTITTLASATNITLVISIGISSVIFCSKLAFAIRSRRAMGMTQFGPMQIIFVMGCQTMFTPLIFTIVAYFGVKKAQVNGVAGTIVALSLPLSAMWATSNTNQRQSTRLNMRQHLLVGGSDLAKTSTAGYYTGTDKSTTLVGDSPRQVDNDLEKGHEMQHICSGRDGDGGVQVERAYCVRSD